LQAHAKQLFGYRCRSVLDQRHSRSSCSEHSRGEPVCSQAGRTTAANYTDGSRGRPVYNETEVAGIGGGRGQNETIGSKAGGAATFAQHAGTVCKADSPCHRPRGAGVWVFANKENMDCRRGAGWLLSPRWLERPTRSNCTLGMTGSAPSEQLRTRAGTAGTAPTEQPRA